jgi:hypothetical protein
MVGRGAPRDDDGRLDPLHGDLRMSSSALAALGILLVLVAIPFGFMLAPLVIGVILVVVSFRRLGRAVGPVEGVPA